MSLRVVTFNPRAFELKLVDGDNVAVPVDCESQARHVRGHSEHLMDAKDVRDKMPQSPKLTLQAIPGEYKKVSLCCLAK